MKPDIQATIQHTTLQTPVTGFVVKTWTSDDTALPVYWQVAGTIIGEVLVAATDKGLCFLGFPDKDPDFAQEDLKRRFPENSFREEGHPWLNAAIEHLNQPTLNLPVQLHLKGTDFQINIWKKLLEIPFGGLTTYKELGGGAKNGRATGSAVGANPVSYILPCHRVVRSDGSYDNYFWGPEMKKKLLTYEAANAPEKQGIFNF